MTFEQPHRPGPLKQKNKKHKTGRHLSKGALDHLNKGRVSTAKHATKRKIELNREERRNQALQIRKKKREEFLEKRRGLCEAPLLVALIPLSADVDVGSVLTAVRTADDQAEVEDTSEGLMHLHVPRWRQRFSFVRLDGENLLDVLDALKVATLAVLVAPYDLELTPETEALLTAIVSQGLPSTTVLIPGLDMLPLKKRADVKVSVADTLERWLPEVTVTALEKPADSLTVLRRLSSQRLRPLHFRESRPHLMADTVNFVETTPGRGNLSVSGHLRGARLSSNQLVHIPGWGTFQLSSIDGGPCAEEMTELQTADPALRESLISENVPDPLDAEQTWPTQEEMDTAKEVAEATKVKRVKRIPKGFSDYQAAWIPDDDAFELSASEDESQEDAMSEGVDSDAELREEDMETETDPSEIPPDKYDSAYDAMEEKEALEKLRKAKEDAEFPDEVDTPADIPARERFQKYRGLLSFRTTPWDPKENLPADYSRIFQFKDFKRTKKAVMHSQELSDGVPVGYYVQLNIEDVPTYLVKYREAGQPLVVFGMFQHEQKMSVLNMLLKQPPSEELPLKSKEILFFQCGFRRFKAGPIYSQHTTGSKFKFERYFRPGDRAVATLYGPVTFPPAPVLAFKENPDASLTLVATGSLLSVDPDRLVIKRTVLSGHPFKVNKRSAVVRFMFFNREDIDWFKPVQLRTKYGRRGHIKEPLGTHGHMKCVFDTQLKSQDTILMHLYKRIYPKWTYNPFTTFSKITEDTEDMETTEELKV